jgi:hypothetical protein
MLTASSAEAERESCCAISVLPPPSGLRISVVTPCVSMFSAVGSAAGTAWLRILIKPGAT